MVSRRTPSPSRNDGREAKKPQRRATAVAPGGRLVLADTGGTSRLFTCMIGNYLHRLERERRARYLGDFDTAMVAEVIGLAAVEPGMRDATFRKQHRNFDSVIGLEGQRAINATSIASASGIPRETVRRKLKQLLKEGVIVEKGRARYVVKPGVLQQPEWQDAFARGIHQTVIFMNECLEQGVLQWVSAPRARRRSGS
jgi:biotin operon repressor